jgi:hypothetical protein
MQALHLMKQEGWKQRDIAVALDVTEEAPDPPVPVARHGGLWLEGGILGTPYLFP